MYHTFTFIHYKYVFLQAVLIFFRYKSNKEIKDLQGTVKLYSKVFEPFNIFTIAFLISCLAL